MSSLDFQNLYNTNVTKQLQMQLPVLTDILIKTLNFSKLLGIAPISVLQLDHNLNINKKLTFCKFDFKWFLIRSLYSLVLQIIYVTVTIWVLSQLSTGKLNVGHLSTKFDRQNDLSKSSNFSAAIFASNYIQYYLSGIGLYLTTFWTTSKMAILLGQSQVLFYKILWNFKTPESEPDIFSKL